VGAASSGILTERFVETVFVHSEAEQLDVSLAMRIAGRGGIVRRVPAGSTPQLGRATSVALRLATGGFVFTTAGDAAVAPPPPLAPRPGDCGARRGRVTLRCAARRYRSPELARLAQTHE